MSEKRGYFGRPDAEALAVDALTYLAGDTEALGRFLSLSGIGPANLRSAAADPGFLAGVIDFFLSNEALLLGYARHAGVPPERIGEARRALGI
jgi:Protein of unknown function (DUF3572)